MTREPSRRSFIVGLVLSRTVLLLSVGFLAAHPAIGQYSHETGLVITVAGDTLTGAVRLGLQSRTVEIRPADSAHVFELASEDVRRVQIATSVFVPTPRISYRGEGTSRSVPYFAELLVEGPATLLAVTENQRFLYLATDQGAVALVSSAEWVYDELVGSEVSMQYQSVLRRHAGDCLRIRERIDLLPMRESAIVDYLRRYNACIAPSDHSYRQSFGKTGVGLHVISGVDVQTTQQFAAVHSLNQIVHYTKPAQAAIFAGLGARLVFPDDHRGRSFDLNVVFRRTSFSDVRNEYLGSCLTDNPLRCPYEPGGEYQFVLTDTKVSSTDVEAIIRFIHPLKRHSAAPSLGLGYAVQAPVSRRADATGLVTFRPFGATVPSSTEPQSFDMEMARPWLHSPVLSVQMMHARWTVDMSFLRYARFGSSGATLQPDYQSHNTWRVSAGYTL